jgi:arabinofuranosyltransferase
VPILFLLHLLLVPLVGAACFPPGIPIDDAYITFRYAENLAAGHGLVYNLGQPWLGTSAPGYAMLLAVLRATTGIEILSAAALVHLAALILIAATSWWLLEDRPLRPLAFLVPYLLAASPVVRASRGMEAVPFVALAFLVLDLHRRRRDIWLGAIAVVLCLFRPDGIVLLALVIADRVRSDRRLPVRVLVGGGPVALAWIVFAFATWGNPVPGTVATKALQATTGLWPESYLRYLVDDFAREPSHIWWILVIPATAIAVWRRDRLDLLIAAWFLLHNTLFVVAAVPACRWYYVIPLAQAAILSVRFAARISLERWGPRLAGAARLTAALVVTAVAATLLLTRLDRPADLLARFSAERLAPPRSGYLHLGRWLLDNTPPDCSVGSMEVGILGYYSGREIVDALGLVTPGVAATVPDRAHIDFLMTRHAPDFFVAGQPLHGHDVNLMQYLDRGYDVRLNLGNRLLLERKPWHEAGLAARAAPLLREAATRSVYFADFPWILDFDRFAACLGDLAPGVHVDRLFSAPHDHVLRLAQNGKMTLVPFRPDTAVRLPASRLAGWRRVGVDALGTPGDEIRLVTHVPYAHLLGELQVEGPIRRFRLRLRVEALGERRGADGRLICTVRRPDGSESSFTLVFTVTRSESPVDRVVRIPGPGIRPGEVLQSVRYELLSRPGRLTLGGMILERQ